MYNLYLKCFVSEIKLKNHIYKIYKTEMFEKNFVEQFFEVCSKSFF